MALIHGEETLYAVNDIPDRMERLRQAGCDLLPLPLREKAIAELRAEARDEAKRRDMTPWESVVGKQGWFQFATPVIVGCEPGQKHDATNVAIGRLVAVLGGIVSIDFSLPLDFKGRRTLFRSHLPAQILVSFLEVASETEAPSSPVTLIRP